MADVTINWDGAKIAELSADGTKTLHTNGKYCEGDITVSYEKVPNSEILGDTPYFSLTYIDVTIGANTVSAGNTAISFLDELAGGKLCAAALLNNPTKNNQIIMCPGAMTNPAYATSTSQYRWMRCGYRYQTDGSFRTIPMHADSPAALVEGSKYRFWIANIDTSNLKPY